MNDVCFLRYNEDYLTLNYQCRFREEVDKSRKQIIVPETKLQVSDPTLRARTDSEPIGLRVLTPNCALC